MATIASLIVDVAANTAQLTKDVKGVQDSLGTMEGFAKKAGTAIVGAFSIGAVTNAVTKFTAFTGTLTDMAAKTGIGTSELQKLKFAAEQNGGSLDQVTKAIGKMGKALVEGKDSTVAAMGRLGLSINDVRNMDPATAFGTISDAIAKVPSPLERSKLAMDLFGKSGAELLPMMTGHLSETMAAAERLGIVLDEQTVAAGDNLGDTMTALQAVGMGVIGKVLAPMLPALQSVANAMQGAGGIVDWLRLGFDALARMVLLAIKSIVDGAIRIGEFAAKIPGLNKLLGEEAGALQKARDASEWLGGAIKGLEQSTTSATMSTVKSIDALKPLPDLHKSAGKAVKDHAVQTAEQVQVMNLLAKAHAHQKSALELEAAAFQASTRAAENYIKNLPTAKMQELIPTLKVVTGLTGEFGTKVQLTVPALAASGAAAQTWGASLKGALSEFASAISGAFSSGGGLLGGIKAFGTQVAKDFTAGILGAIPGIGPILAQFAGPLVDGFKKIVGAIAGVFDRNKGRDLIAEFAAGFGGFDSMHRVFLEMGDAGEAMWVRVTQSVGRNDQEGARAAIAAANALLDAHKKKQAETGKAAEDAAAAQIAALTASHAKATDVVKQLDSQIKTLEDSIANEAPEEVMGIVEAQTRARIDGLKKEREAAQTALEKLTETMTTSIQDVKTAIEDLPEKIRLTFDWSQTGRPGATEPTQGFAMGGRVLPFASGGMAPMGSDTVPAMLTPGEVVLNAAQQRRVAGAIQDGGRDARLRAMEMRMDADRAFLLVQVPKAITAAIQKGAA